MNEQQGCGVGVEAGVAVGRSRTILQRIAENESSDCCSAIDSIQHSFGEVNMTKRRAYFISFLHLFAIVFNQWTKLSEHLPCPGVRDIRCPLIKRDWER